MPRPGGDVSTLWDQGVGVSAEPLLMVEPTGTIQESTSDGDSLLMLSVVLL